MMFNRVYEKDKLLNKNIELLPDSPLSLEYIPLPNNQLIKLTNSQINSFNDSNNNKTQLISSKMYLVEQSVNNYTNTSNHHHNLNTNSASTTNSNKNLVNNLQQQQQQTFCTLDSPLSSISSCESGIEQNHSSPCNLQLTNNNNFNCETDCLLNGNINQQQSHLNNYQSNSFVNNYSNDNKSSVINKLKNNQLSTIKTSLDQSILNDTDFQTNYDYIDNKFDNLFCWNSSESIANYNDQLDTNQNECDYFILNRSKADDLGPNLNSTSVHNDEQQNNLNRQANKKIDKKPNLLTASESQQLAELLTLNDLNTTLLDNPIQSLETNQFTQTTKTNWQTQSIFDWTTQDLTNFLYSIALQHSYPIEDLRAYFLCYSPIQLANMNKEQFCCINNKYGPIVYQAINRFKADFNSFSGNVNYFNQQHNQQHQNSNYQQSIQSNFQIDLSTKQISNYNNNETTNLNNNYSNSYLTNLPSFDLLRNSCYDLESTDQSPSSLSESDRDSTSSSMTAVNENLNRQIISNNQQQQQQQQQQKQNNELFCVSNTLTNDTDCHRQNSTTINQNNHQQLFHHSNQQITQNLNQSNILNNNNTTTFTNLTNVTNLNNSSIQTNCLNNNAYDHQKNVNTIDGIKKCDQNNNIMNNDQLSNRINGNTGTNDSQICINNSNMNNLHQLNVHNQTNQTYVNHHNFHHNPLNHLNHLDSSLNNNSNNYNNNNNNNIDNTITKLNVSGRRGRPPKKESAKSRSRQNRGKTNGKLWEFIRDLLLDPATNPSFIRWERREDGVFKFVQSDKVARLWGARKQNPRMTYEKLSRAMRYYYKSQVLMPVFGRRLVYKFGPGSTGWRF